MGIPVAGRSLCNVDGEQIPKWYMIVEQYINTCIDYIVFIGKTLISVVYSIDASHIESKLNCPRSVD